VKPPTPRAAVLADLVQRLDHQRVLAALRSATGGSLPCLTSSASCGASLNVLGSFAAFGHDLRPFELPDQALASVLRDGRGGDADERHHRHGDRELRSEGAIPHMSSPFGRVSGLVRHESVETADYRDIPATSPEPRDLCH